MDKKIVFSSEARVALLDGVDKLANAVVATLGPSGRNAIIEQDMGNPISTKDGVTVAKAIELKESRKLSGALKLYKQVKESKKSSPKLLKILKSYIKERK